jgi:Zn-dependent peptidase ImmA (M78 family)
LTGTDFVSAVDLNDIELVMTKDTTRGFYYFTNNTHTIVLSPRMPRRQRQIVGWHEFAHFLQNYYQRRVISAFSGLEPNKESEKLADVFAMIATNPDRIRITRPMDFIKMLLTNK